MAIAISPTPTLISESDFSNADIPNGASVFEIARYSKPSLFAVAYSDEENAESAYLEYFPLEDYAGIGEVTSLYNQDADGYRYDGCPANRIIRGKGGRFAGCRPGGSVLSTTPKVEAPTRITSKTNIAQLRAIADRLGLEKPKNAHKRESWREVIRAHPRGGQYFGEAKKQKNIAEPKTRKTKTKRMVDTHLNFGVDLSQSSSEYLLQTAKVLEEKYGFTKQESVRATWGVHTFTTSLYPKIRAADRGENKSVVMQRHAKGINKYLEKMPKHDGVIYRGLEIDENKFDTKIFEKSLTNPKGLDAFSSFSTDREVAERFARRGVAGSIGEDKFEVILTVRNKSGVSIQALSRTPQEDEVLVPKGTKYKILAKKDTTKMEEDEYADLDEPVRVRTVEYILEEV